MSQGLGGGGGGGGSGDLRVAVFTVCHLEYTQRASFLLETPGLAMGLSPSGRRTGSVYLPSSLKGRKGGPPPPPAAWALSYCRMPPLVPLGAGLSSHCVGYGAVKGFGARSRVAASGPLNLSARGRSQEPKEQLAKSPCPRYKGQVVAPGSGHTLQCTGIRVHAQSPLTGGTFHE